MSIRAHEKISRACCCNNARGVGIFILETNMVECPYASVETFMMVLIRLGVSPAFRSYHDVIAAMQMAIARGQCRERQIRVVPADTNLAQRIPPFLQQLQRTPGAWGVDVPAHIPGVHTFDLNWDGHVQYYNDGAWAGVYLAPRLGG